MDARTEQAADRRARRRSVTEEARALAETITVKRDRLLASLTLIAGIGADRRASVRAAGRRRILPAGDRRAGGRDRAGAVARMVRAARRAVAARRPACACIIFLPMAIFAIGSIVVPATDWVALVPERIGKVRAGARAGARPLQEPRPVHRPHDLADRSRPATSARTVRIETPNSVLGLLDHLGAAPADPAVLRAAGDLLLPRRLDHDAQADDRQPRQLRRRADHRPGDPAGGRRDLDLSRHDHAHQRRPRRADRAGPVVARHAVAGDVGRHRRGAATTSPISGRSPRRCCCSSAG